MIVIYIFQNKINIDETYEKKKLTTNNFKNRRECLDTALVFLSQVGPIFDFPALANFANYFVLCKERCY